jgi:DNA invertase Pin-like site-specific DNA recombinase
MVYCFCTPKQEIIAEKIAKKQGIIIGQYCNSKNLSLSDTLSMLNQHDTLIICSISDIASSFSLSISFISFVLDNKITLICAAPDLILTEHDKDKDIIIGMFVAVKLKRHFERKTSLKKVGRPQGNSSCDAHKATIVEMLAKGIPFTVISRKINVKYTTLKGYCNRHGLKKIE